MLALFFKILFFSYKVYAIDSICHAKSEKLKYISYELMAKDIIEFIKTLNIKKYIGWC